MIEGVAHLWKEKTCYEARSETAMLSPEPFSGFHKPLLSNIDTCAGTSRMKESGEPTEGEL